MGGATWPRLASRDDAKLRPKIIRAYRREPCGENGHLLTSRLIALVKCGGKSEKVYSGRVGWVDSDDDDVDNRMTGQGAGPSSSDEVFASRHRACH